ncbi:MAG: cysteine peptidase family C39 domain-containing protein [Cyanobacteria bacterium P01_F01_bin.150]
MRSLLLSACGVAIGLCWRTSRKQVVAIAFIGAIGFVGFWGLESHLMAPIYPSLDRTSSIHNVVQQTSASSCAPAALATVLKQWNIYSSEAEIAKLAQTSRLGTSIPHLIFAARQLGMDGLDLEPSWQTIQQINRPGVLSVWVDNGDRRLPHALALLEMDHDTVVVADPALGQAFRLERGEVEAMWRSYVPIFRPPDVALSRPQTSTHPTQPFIQSGPTLTSQAKHPMTVSDYHHLESQSMLENSVTVKAASK